VNRIQENKIVTKTVRLFDKSSVEYFCSFQKNNKYLDYLPTEVGKIYIFLKELKNWVFCDTDGRK